ncbi:MAG: hypothetical protein KIS61_04325, partial [Candidatus Eremiobacteraeota bacterium]|nr:hypothetical protein [Candidatus Eremiobacteraeota bacterium]
ELETLRVQLAARGGPSAETELMLAEREQLRAENKVLLAKITLLEGRLQDSKVSMARSFTLEDNGPLSARAKELNALALHSPSPENRLLAAQADVAKDLYDADQLTEEVDRLTGVWFDELRRLERQLQAKESENAALREENERMHSELEVLGMVRSVYRNKQDQADLVKRLAQVQLASLDGSSPGLEATRAREQKALRECQEKNAQLIERLEALVKFAPAKRVYISRDFRRMNSMPGMGDILDIPVKTGPELQSLP